MKLVILRSHKSGEEPPPEDLYSQEFDTHYADRVIGNLYGAPTFCGACVTDCIQCREPYERQFAPDIIHIESFPAVLPYVLEDPGEYVPDDLPDHDVLLVIAIHEQILLECLKLCKNWGTRAVVVPIEEPGWISHSARTKARAICEAAGIEIAFPKPFCSFKPPVGTLLDQFRRHFHIGHPEVELTVKDGKIAKANVVVSGPCGSTYYVARGLKGRSVDDDLVTEVISKRMSGFPCTASMEKDPELHNDTPMHMAVQAHQTIMGRLKVSLAEKDDFIVSPMGRLVHKPAPPADTQKNIDEAKQLILGELDRHSAVTFDHLCKAGRATPAALLSALVLLAKEGKIQSSGGKAMKDKVWKLRGE